MNTLYILTIYNTCMYIVLLHYMYIYKMGQGEGHTK